MKEGQGIYVFCSVQSEEEQDFGTIQFEGKEREIFTIHYQDAAMVAVNVPMKIYHPSKDNLMMHQQVLSKVMETMDAVVPISFGNVFHSEVDVIALARSLYPQLEKIFPEIKGKIEVGLKVIGKKEWLEENIHQDEKVMKKKQVVQSKSKAAGYFDRIQLGEMAKNFFHNLQETIKTDIHDALTPLAEADRINDPTVKKCFLMQPI